MKNVLCILNVFVLVFCFAVRPAAIDTSAASAVLMDAVTGVILYAENKDEKRGIASTTKIMTALVILEECELRAVVKTESEAVTVEGSSMGLKAGDTLTVKELLYGLLLVSGNDAANVLAYYAAGGLDAFAEMMNKKAAEIGMKNSHFTNPSGLSDDAHYSTAYDMALLTNVALKHPVFSEIVKTYSITLEYGVPASKHTLVNHNRLLKSYSGTIGVKTGYTIASGRCLVTAAVRNGCTLIAVTLGDGNDWQDHKNLYNYGFSDLWELRDDKKYQIRVVGGNKNTVKASAEGHGAVSVPSAVKKEIKKQVYVNHFLYAPVSGGDIAGKVVFTYQGKALISYNLTADGNVALKQQGKKESIMDKIKRIWSNYAG